MERVLTLTAERQRYQFLINNKYRKQRQKISQSLLQCKIIQCVSLQSNLKPCVFLAQILNKIVRKRKHNGFCFMLNQFNQRSQIKLHQLRIIQKKQKFKQDNATDYRQKQFRNQYFRKIIKNAFNKKEMIILKQSFRMLKQRSQKIKRVKLMQYLMKQIHQRLLKFVFLQLNSMINNDFNMSFSNISEIQHFNESEFDKAGISQKNIKNLQQNQQQINNHQGHRSKQLEYMVNLSLQKFDKMKEEHQNITRKKLADINELSDKINYLKQIADKSKAVNFSDTNKTQTTEILLKKYMQLSIELEQKIYISKNMFEQPKELNQQKLIALSQEIKFILSEQQAQSIIE